MKRRKYTVRLLRAAEDDFTEIVTYIAAQRSEAAEALAQRIEENLQGSQSSSLAASRRALL